MSNEEGFRISQTPMNAKYSRQKIAEYAGNPLIEALPPILETEEAVIDALYSFPLISEDEKRLSPRIKAHILMRVKSFLQPLPTHIRLEAMMSALIRNSYKYRNPSDISYKSKLQKLYQLKEMDNCSVEHIENCYQGNGATAECLFINGVSGAGKTTAVTKILNMYPQVIRHTHYNGEILTKTQIVWLKIDCPYDGNFSTLCRSVFNEIDRVTGERWLEKYGYLTRSASTMLMHLTTLLVNYNVGVLVIDEIQHLSKLKNEAGDMLDFLVTLTNMFSVPMIFIGTSNARRLFQYNFRLARRVQSGGYIEMGPLKKNSVEWDTLVDSLWEFNVLEEETILDEKMREVFFDLCQGIISLAVMLFMCAQSRALLHQMPRMTISLIKEAAENDLSCMKPMITALRSGDPLKIAEFDDISIDEEVIWRNYQNDIEMEERVNDAIAAKKQEIKERKQSLKDTIFYRITGSNLFPHISHEMIREIIEELFKKNNYEIAEDELLAKTMECIVKENQRSIAENKMQNNGATDGLMVVFERAISRKEHPYNHFLEAGYIKNPFDEFLEAK